MRAVIEPKSQPDVLRNRQIILEHIRGLTAAARLEKPRPAGPLQMRFPFEAADWKRILSETDTDLQP